MFGAMEPARLKQSRICIFCLAVASVVPACSAGGWATDQLIHFVCFAVMSGAGEAAEGSGSLDAPANGAGPKRARMESAPSTARSASLSSLGSLAVNGHRSPPQVTTV